MHLIFCRSTSEGGRQWVADSVCLSTSEGGRQWVADSVCLVTSEGGRQWVADSVCLKQLRQSQQGWVRLRFYSFVFCFYRSSSFDKSSGFFPVAYETGFFLFFFMSMSIYGDITNSHHQKQNVRAYSLHRVARTVGIQEQLSPSK